MRFLQLAKEGLRLKSRIFAYRTGEQRDRVVWIRDASDARLGPELGLHAGVVGIAQPLFELLDCLPAFASQLLVALTQPLVFGSQLSNGRVSGVGSRRLAATCRHCAAGLDESFGFLNRDPGTPTNLGRRFSLDPGLERGLGSDREC